MKTKLLKLICCLTLLLTLLNIKPQANNDINATIKSNLLQMISGSQQLNQNPELAKKIRYIHSEAQKVNKIDIVDNEFSTLPLLKDNQINDINTNNTFINIYKLALAFNTYTNTIIQTDDKQKLHPDLYQNEAVKNKIISLMENIYEKHLKDKTKTYTGNWYFWEISLPQNISKTIILMENHLSNELIQKYIKFMDENLRAGLKDNTITGNIVLDSKYHTGANLMDISLNRILQGAITKNNDRIVDAVKKLQTALVKIDPNNIVNNNVDGVYADNSFIQHLSVAYSGSYGKVFIDKIIQSLFILKNTNADIKPQSFQFIFDLYEKTFLPIIYEGYVLENVKGRAVSRTATGYSDGLVFLESLAVFSEILNDATLKQKAQQYAKYLDSKIPTYAARNFNNLSTFDIINNIKQDQAIKATYIPQKHYAFNLMDRNVATHDDYLFTISRSSNRISKYEYMSKENTKPWLQGDGMHYLYLKGEKHDIHYGNAYFNTIDALELPGTIKTSEERIDPVTLLGANFNFDSHKEKRNEFLFFPRATNTISSSIALENTTFASMQLGDDEGYIESLNPNSIYLPKEFKTYKNVEGNKSWLMLDGEIVVLNSNITHPNKQFTITNTIDNRKFNEKDKIFITTFKDNVSTEVDNNTKSTTPLVTTNIDKVSLTTGGRGKIGYYFFDSPTVSITNEIRKGNNTTVRPIGNATNQYTNQYFKMQVDQTNTPNLAYVILPNKDKAFVEKYKPSFKLLRNDQVHHLKKGNVEYISFFAQDTASIFKPQQPVIIINEQVDDNTFVLKINDSTLTQKNLKIELICEPHEQFVVTNSDTDATIKNNVLNIATEKNTGKTYTVAIKKVKKIVLNNDKVTLSTHSDNIPENTQLAITKISDVHADLKNLDLETFDIKLMHNNVEIQPKHNVEIKIPLTKERKFVGVYYISNGKSQKIPHTVENDIVTFETNHFSIYALAYQKATITPKQNDTKQNVDTSNQNNNLHIILLLSAIVLLIKLKTSNKKEIY